MADAVTSTTLSDSDRSAVIQLTSTSDGTGESAVTKVDVSALAPRKSDGAACTGCRLAKIIYSTQGMGVKLLWDATVDTICYDIPENFSDSEDFSEYGGLRNTSTTGKTGDIKLTTIGHTNGDTYVLVLQVFKDFD